MGNAFSSSLESHANSISFFIPETVYAEADEHLAELVVKLGGDPAKAVRLPRATGALGTVVSRDLYDDF